MPSLHGDDFFQHFFLQFPWIFISLELQDLEESDQVFLLFAGQSCDKQPCLLEDDFIEQGTTLMIHQRTKSRGLFRVAFSDVFLREKSSNPSLQNWNLLYCFRIKRASQHNPIFLGPHGFEKALPRDYFRISLPQKLRKRRLAQIPAPAWYESINGFDIPWTEFPEDPFPASWDQIFIDALFFKGFYQTDNEDFFQVRDYLTVPQARGGRLSWKKRYRGARKFARYLIADVYLAGCSFRHPLALKVVAEGFSSPYAPFFLWDEEKKKILRAQGNPKICLFNWRAAVFMKWWQKNLNSWQKQYHVDAWRLWGADLIPEGPLRLLRQHLRRKGYVSIFFQNASNLPGQSLLAQNPRRLARMRTLLDLEIIPAKTLFENLQQSFESFSSTDLLAEEIWQIFLFSARQGYPLALNIELSSAKREDAFSLAFLFLLPFSMMFSLTKSSMILLQELKEKLQGLFSLSSNRGLWTSDWVFYFDENFSRWEWLSACKEKRYLVCFNHGGKNISLQLPQGAFNLLKHALCEGNHLVLGAYDFCFLEFSSQKVLLWPSW